MCVCVCVCVCVCLCACVHVLSHVQLFATPWTVARQTPLVHGIFPGKNTGAGHHFLLQGIFLNQGLNPCVLSLLHWQADCLPLCHLGSHMYVYICPKILPSHPPKEKKKKVLGHKRTNRAQSLVTMGTGTTNTPVTWQLTIFTF